MTRDRKGRRTMTVTPLWAENLDGLPDREDLLGRSGLQFMQDMVAGRLAGPPIGRVLNFWPTLAEEGRVVFAGVAGFDALNPVRGVHGGWYGAILDSCLGCAVMTTLPRGATYTTLDFRTNITRALPTGVEVAATGTVEHAGRRTAVARGEVRGVEDGKLYATGSTTCMIFPAGG